MTVVAGAGADVFRFFRQRGLSPAQAAGIVGNTQQESGNDPNAAGGGLIQGQGGRTSSGTLRQQLEGVWRELTGPERGTLNALRGARDPRTAARIFSQRFERPGTPMLGNRERYAEEALRNYGGPETSSAPLGGARGGSSPGGALSAARTSSGASQPSSEALAEVLAAVKAMSGPSVVAAGASPARPAFSAGPTLPEGARAVPALTPAKSPQSELLPLLEKALGAAGNVESSVEQTHAPGTPTAPTPKAEGQIGSILSEANHISNAHVPYLWGGGHAGKILPGGKVTPLDCSGAVSAALGINPKVSGEFASWGAPGKGQHVTIYANDKHVLMEVDGRFWGTSGSNPGGGAGWIKPGVIGSDYLKAFTARHPGGL